MVMINYWASYSLKIKKRKNYTIILNLPKLLQYLLSIYPKPIYLPHFNITFYADMWLWLKIHFISQVWEAVVAEEGGGEEPEEGGGEGEAGDKPGVPQKVW